MFHEKCIEIREKHLGKNHISTAIDLTNLGNVLLDQDEIFDAIQI